MRLSTPQAVSPTRSFGSSGPSTPQAAFGTPVRTRGISGVLQPSEPTLFSAKMRTSPTGRQSSKSTNSRFSDGPRANFAESVAGSANGHWRSVSPRFSPNRTFGGKDPRAFLADVAFSPEESEHKYQPVLSPHTRQKGRHTSWESSHASKHESHAIPHLLGYPNLPSKALLQSTHVEFTQPAVDLFRPGVIIKEPARPTSPFASTIPRLTRDKRLEPFRRQTYGAELNAGLLSAFHVRKHSHMP